MNEYLKEQEIENKSLFKTSLIVGRVLGVVLGKAMLIDNKLRIILIIVLALLCINGFIIQMCNILQEYNVSVGV